ncbi:MAG: hypothetical protein MUF14_09955 [Hyphomonadaceae bacterium]|nr:hypothetical protein [Hyphomonadaceae bacterium]
MSDQRIEMDQTGYTVRAPDDPQTDAAAVAEHNGPGASVWWRLLPALLLILAWLPGLAGALTEISTPGYAAVVQAAGGPLEQGMLAWFGPAGPSLAAPLVALVSAAGVWLLTRSLVGAAMLVALAFVVQAVQVFSPKALAIAFVVVIIAAWLRPWAAWPALAVLLSVVLVTRAFAERPWCGAIAALCWGPGLFLAQLFGETNGFNGGVFASAEDPAARLSVGLNTTAAAASVDWFGAAMSLLAIALPLIILAVLACGGVLLCWLTGDRRKLAATAASIFVAASLVGALGYGDAEAARLLLDPMLLGLAGVIGLVAPAAARRFMARRTARGS